jgi:hypothetical protein
MERATSFKREDKQAGTEGIGAVLSDIHHCRVTAPFQKRKQTARRGLSARRHCKAEWMVLSNAARVNGLFKNVMPDCKASWSAINSPEYPDM